MALQTPVVLVSGAFSTLPPGDTIGPATDPTAQASGNAALVLANIALASGNAGLVSASNKVPISGGYMTGQLFAASGVVVSGTLSRNGYNVVTVGDVETVTSTMIASGTIIDADVNISGAINATKLSFLQAGTGAATRTVDSKLKDFISTADFGIPGDLTDDGNNHTRLKNAAVAAVNSSLPLLIIGKILVSDTVDWNTSGASYGGGGGKSLSIFGNNTGGGAETGIGIYGKAASFQGTSKKVVVYKGQNRSQIAGLALKLYQPSAIYTFANFVNVTQLWIEGTDRCLVCQCSIGGLARPGATDVGAGIALQFDDCISCCVEYCDIQYVSNKGLAYSKTTGAMRTGTSFAITACHFSVGKSTAINRNECEALDLSGTQTWFISNCVFENNNKGRAIRLDGESSFINNNWFEGNYDTILIAGGIGAAIRDNYGIGYNPALSYIEGYLSYTPPSGVLAIGTPDATALANTSIDYANFYQKGSQSLGSQNILGNLTVSNQILGNTLHTYSNTGVNVVVGDSSAYSTVTNDQTHLIIDHFSSNVAGLKISTAGTLKISIITNTNDANNGCVFTIYDNTRRFTFQDSSGSRDIYYLKYNYLLPGADNVAKLGDSAYRWSTVYAATGTINTSDKREKQNIEELNEAEKRVAKKIKRIIKKFLFKDAVLLKGENARIHIGVLTQEVMEIFEEEQLDPFRYGIVCYDQWEAEYDEEGIELKPAGDRYGIRYEELLMFMMATL